MPRFLSGIPCILIIALVSCSSFAQDIPERDDFEYSHFESEFNWLEIEDIGTRLEDISDNDFQGPFPIGFQFPFYGRTYEEFWVGSNGFIGFGPTINYISYANQDFPDARPPNNIIALFWKNLDPPAHWANGAIYRGMREGRLVVQWEGVAERNIDGHDPDNTITMQVVLDPNGDILMQYESVGDDFDLDTGTVGIEGHDGDEGAVFLLDGEGEIEIGNETAFMISLYGPGNYLIWDGGSVTSSGDEQERTLSRLGHSVTHFRFSDGDELTDIEDIDDFHAVFVNLGNHGVNGQNYHALTEEEGTFLAGYLEGGGNLYVEGSDTWYSDRVTDVHPYFNIEGLAEGEPLEPPVTAIEGSFAEGLIFNRYRARDNDYIDHLSPREDAEAVFTFYEDDREYTGMISRLGQGYRTIGCSFEFGALADGNGGTRQDLMSRIVGFFRTLPPAFPAPVDLQVDVGDEEISLSWDMPRRDLQQGRRLIELEREIARLTDVRSGRKPDRATREQIISFRQEIARIDAEMDDIPRRDELDGFNIYMNDELYDYTNAYRYTAIELDNGREYSFSVSAVYVNPDGESERLGPITAMPVGTIDAPFDFDFEQSNGGLYSLPLEDGWEWGEPSEDIGAADGERAWGTLLEEGYPDLAEFYLNLPPVNMEEMDFAWLAFDHYMDAEGGFDGGHVEISLDNGMRWEVLEPRSGYNEESIVAFNGDCGFSGRSNGWEPVAFDLNEYRGEVVRIRLVFKSDDSNFREYSGWYVDNMTIFRPELGRVLCSVLDEEEQSPIEGAFVQFGDFWSGYTDVRGETPWIEDVPANDENDPYVVRASRLGYSPEEVEGNVIARENNTFTIYLSQYYSELSFEAEVEREIQLDYDQTTEEEISILNEDELETEYQIYIDYYDLEGVPARGHGRPEHGELWELIKTYDLTSETGEQYFTGAQFIRDGSPAGYKLFASAGDFGSGDCRFYNYYRDGKYAGSVSQGGGANGWGFRDLAYDPERNRIYGSKGPEIYRIDPRNGAAVRYVIPEVDLLTVNRALAYIPEEDAFWIGDWDDAWYKLDRDGRILDIVPSHHHGLTGVVGMAWNPADPDGAFLYVHNQTSQDGGGAIYRFNPETRELSDPFQTAAVDEGYAGGAFVTWLYDTHSYVLGVLIQEPERDVVKLYQLQPRHSWLSVDHSYSRIDPFSERGLTITYDATGYDQIDLEADIELHDLMSGETVQINRVLLVNGPASVLEGLATIEGDEEENIEDIVFFLNDEQIDPEWVQNNEEVNYRFMNRRPGEYILEARLEGYDTHVSDVIEIPEDEVVRYNFSLIPLRYGTIHGTVVSVYDDTAMVDVEVAAILEGVEGVFITDTTDEEGIYIIDDLPIGTYTVRPIFSGWRADQEEGVEIEGDDNVEVNFVMDDRMGVSAIRTNGNHDDRIVVNWLTAGVSGEIDELHYDDGVLVGGVYLVNRNDIIASRFEPHGMYDIVSLSVYILTRDDLGDFGLSNNFDNPLYYKVFKEDAEERLPDTLIVDEYVDQHFGRQDDGWTTISIDDQRFLEGSFYFGWNRVPHQGSYYEIGGLDENFDNDRTCFIRIDNVWREYNDFPGDVMIRAVIWNHTEGRDEVLAPARSLRRVGSGKSGEPPGGIELVEPAFSYSHRTRNPFDWRDIFSRIGGPRRDLLVGYNVFVDGELVVEDTLETEWVHIVGSNNEDTEYTYNVKAVYETGEELGDVEVTAAANMAPDPVSVLRVDNDGENFTLRWSQPVVNEDDSECIDYAGAEVYMEGERVAIPGPNESSWEGRIDQGEEGWYSFRVIAFDEVPNMSRPADLTAPLGVAVVYDFERFDHNIFTLGHPDDGWEETLSSRYGPCGAHSGRYYWGTRPWDGRYEDNVDWSITTVREFMVETENASLEFYHYYSTDPGHDGGQVLISSGGEQWEIIEPLGGYPDQTVAALRNTPGYAGQTDGWVLTTFDLTPHRDRLIRLKWRFASDQSISWYTGWYIDDVVLWGCSIPSYADVSGIVRDQFLSPVPESIVRCGRKTTSTDEEGFFFISELLPGEYTITASKPGYRDALAQIEVDAGDQLEVPLILQHPMIVVEPESFEFVLGGGDRAEVGFMMYDRSDLASPYMIRIYASPAGMHDRSTGRVLRSISCPLASSLPRFLNDSSPKRDEPWDTVFDIDLSEATGLRRITGAEFADGRFFITSADPDRGAAVSVLSRDGDLLYSFDQPFEVQGWGLRDLAWDGAYLYGSQDLHIYAFSPDGEAISQFEGAPLPLNRALAYDPEADAFWAAELSDAWYLVDRQGNVLYEWFDHGLYGVCGLAYYPAAEDDLTLYALNLEDDNRTRLYRANPYSGEIERIPDLEWEDVPVGCFITGTWDSDYWIFGGVFGSEEQYMVGLEMDFRDGWLRADPIEGQLDADEPLEIILRVQVPEDAAQEDNYSAEVVIWSFGGVQATVSLELQIVEGFIYFDEPEESDHYMTLEISTVEVGGRDLPIGSEIGVLTPRGDVGGVVRWGGVPAFLLAYSSETGFRPGERFDFRVWDIETEEEHTPDVEFLDGPSLFRIRDRSVVRLVSRLSSEQTITLRRGWSLISTYVDPFQPDITDVLSAVHEAGQLIIIKDHRGNFWWPEFNYNGLGGWNVFSAYQIKVTEATEFEVVGLCVSPDTPFQLNAGWNTISYLLDHPVNCSIVFEEIVDYLVIAKNGFGDFYMPEYGYNGLGNMVPGQGYKLYVTRSLEFAYDPGDGGQLSIPPCGEIRYEVLTTGSDMSLLVTDAGILTPANDVEIVVYAGEERLEVGSAFLDELPCGVVIRGDDPTSSTARGAREGDNLTISVRIDNREHKVITSILTGDLEYHTDNIAVIGLELARPAIPVTYTAPDVCPNPFNGHARIYFGLPEAADVSLVVYDIIGRKVLDIPSRKYQAGFHSLNIDGSLWASGIYLAEVTTPMGRTVRKLVLNR